MFYHQLRFGKLSRWVFGALTLVGIASTSYADTMLFNFNSLADGASNSSIQTYIQGVLNAGSGGTVIVSGAVAESNYNGDNHVVGGTYNNNNYSNTLGTSDGSTGPLNGQRAPTQNGSHYDTFIVNNNFVQNGSDKITVTFTLPIGFQIDSVSFDYEIFPNAQCPGGNGNSNCSTTPDFTFKADGATKLSQLASKPASAANNSPLSNSETAWQFIGVSGIININDANNITAFEFIDWPAEIGIDNLAINYHRPPERTADVPEPGTFLLLGSGIIGLSRYESYRRRKRAV